MKNLLKRQLYRKELLHSKVVLIKILNAIQESVIKTVVRDHLIGSNRMQQVYSKMQRTSRHSISILLTRLTSEL